MRVRPEHHQPARAGFVRENGVAVNYLSESGCLRARMTDIVDTSAALRRAQFRAAEGMAGATYFGLLSVLLKQQQEEYKFSRRTRRPPRCRRFQPRRAILSAGPFEDENAWGNYPTDLRVIAVNLSRFRVVLSKEAGLLNRPLGLVTLCNGQGMLGIPVQVASNVKPQTRNVMSKWMEEILEQSPRHFLFLEDGAKPVESRRQIGSEPEQRPGTGPVRVYAFRSDTMTITSGSVSSERDRQETKPVATWPDPQLDQYRPVPSPLHDL